MMKQRENEALAHYLDGWAYEFGEVEPVYDRTVINTLHNSLQPGKLYESFLTDSPSTYQEAMTRAQNHERADEASRARQEEAGGFRRDRRPDNGRDNRGKGKMFDRQLPNFSKLNRPVTEVVKYLQDCNMVAEPEPPTEKGDRLKYFTYHRTPGHNTLECYSLKNVIDELMRKGLLDRFMKKDKKSWSIFRKNEKKRDKGPEENNEKKDKPRISVIYGGSSEGGSSSRQNKHWATVSFVGAVQAG